MKSSPDLTGLSDADLAYLIERATHLRAWIAASGGEIIFDGSGMYSPISITDVLGRATADDLAAGLAHRDRLLCLLAFGIGASTHLGVDRFADERLFEALREINRVVLQESVAGLTVDGADERLSASAQVLPSSGRVGVDPGSEHQGDVCAPGVNDTGELLSADRQGVGVDGALGHGSDLLERVLNKIGSATSADAEGCDTAPLACIALRRALKAVGGPAALSRELGISSPAISQWLQVPVARVLDVERVTGVSRHELRPDIYPPDDAPAVIHSATSLIDREESRA